MQRTLARKSRGPLWVFALCAVLLNACTGGSGTTSTTAKLVTGGNVTVRLPVDWTTLDPALAFSIGDIQMVLALYDRLVNIDRTGNIVSGLASSWTSTASSATFSLKKGPTCTDGTPITPEVVAASIQRMNAPSTHSPLASQSVGSAPYTVTADDSTNSITIQLTQPWADLLPGMAMPWASIVCPAGLAHPAQLATTPSGSGPFQLGSSVRGDHYTLLARKGYNWGPNGESTAVAGFPATLTMDVINNESTAANLLLSGGLNIGSVTGPDLTRVTSDASLYRTVQNYLTSDFLLFNERPGRPGSDRAVRQAISALVNRKQWLEASSFGQGTVATSYLASSVPCFDPKTAQMVSDPGPSEAAAVLKADGYAMNGQYWEKNGSPLTVTIIGITELQNQGPEYLLSTLRAAGIDATLKNGNLSNWLSISFGTGQWDVTVFPLVAQLRSPAVITSAVTGLPPPAGINSGDVQNSTFNSANASVLTVVGPERCTYADIDQEALIQNFDLKPLSIKAVTWAGSNAQFTVVDSGLDPLSVRQTAS